MSPIARGALNDRDFDDEDGGGPEIPPTRSSKNNSKKRDHRSLSSLPMLGTTVDGFKILSLIGEGGFSQVYKVSPEGLDEQHFAFKFVPNKAHASLLEAEAQILSKLKHPNIPTPIKLGSYAGGLYLVMDYIPNTLRNLLQTSGGRLPLTQSLQITRGLLNILKYAHSCGIVHKDLKPANIGVDENNNVYLFDFNIAKTLQTTPESRLEIENSGLQSEVVNVGGVQKSLLGGTEGYQSPEQRRLEVQGRVYPVDAKSDIYTTGIVLYQLLMGSCPFGSYAKPSTNGYPGWVDTIIDGALQPNPEQRLSANEMLEHIGRGLEGEYDRVPEPEQPSRLWAFTKTAAILPFKIVFSPLYLAYYLLSGGLVTSANKIDNEILVGLASLLTLALWSSPFWGIPLGYKIKRDHELQQAFTNKSMTGSLVFIKNRNISFIPVEDACNKTTDPHVVITNNDVEDLVYVGDYKIAYIYRRALWVSNLKDGTNKQILATKGNLDDRYISRIESLDNKIYFKLSTHRWFTIDVNGNDLKEISILPAFKAKNVSPDNRFQINKGKITWNDDKWGSLDLNLDSAKSIWVSEKL